MLPAILRRSETKRASRHAALSFVCGHCRQPFAPPQKAGPKPRWCLRTCKSAASKRKGRAEGRSWAFPPPRACRQCGVAFTALDGGPSKFCMPACRAIWAADNQGSPFGFRARLKKLGRPEPAVIEVFYPFEIFSRDAWTCQECGVSTPRALRGTKDPAAPEVDHRQPVGAGGDHSRANTRCLCRRCNQRKGKADKLLAQASVEAHLSATREAL